MNAPSLNKQIKETRDRIDEARFLIDDASASMIQELQDNPEIIYLAMLSSLYIGYKNHDKISTLRLLTLPAKIL